KVSAIALRPAGLSIGDATMLRGKPATPEFMVWESESEIPVGTIPWLIMLNQSPAFWPRKLVLIWARVSPIQISSASIVSVKKFITEGFSRRAAGGTVEVGGTTAVSMARPEPPSKPKKLWTWFTWTVLFEPGASACALVT